MVVGLPGPDLRIGRRGRHDCSGPTETQEPSHSPGARPEIRKGRTLAEDAEAKKIKIRTVKKKMDDVLVVIATLRTRRRRGPTNPMKIRRQKQRVSVGTKAGEFTADRTRKKTLRLVNFREPTSEKRRREMVPPSFKEPGLDETE